MTREMSIAKALVCNPHIGVREKELYFKRHFLNARNEVNRIEQALDIEICRVREKSNAGRNYTRYLLKDAEQIRKIAAFYNLKLKFQHEKRKKYLDELPISESDIQHSIKLLGETL